MMQHTAHRKIPPPSERFAHPARNVEIIGAKPGMSVADFGAGSGAYALHFAKAVGQKGSVYAIDVQQGLLRRLHNEARQQGIKNIKIIWADLEQPKASKITSGIIDLVFISNLLFQIENKHAVLGEARRIINPLGQLVIIDWSDSFDGMGPHRSDVVPGERALRIARQSGFDFVRAFEAGAHHWGIIARPSLASFD